MNAYGILAALAIMACLAGWGSWETGKVDKLQGQLDSRIAQEQTAAAQAKLDAAAEEKRQLDALNSQTSIALQSAQDKQKEAQLELQAYLAKGRANKGEDLSHKCFNVPIASDMLPAK